MRKWNTTTLLIAIAFFTIGGCNSSGTKDNSNITFTDVTFESGLMYKHDTNSAMPTQPEIISGGVAAGDHDSDGWVDLYVISGAGGSNMLFRNLGNGQFEEIGAEAGINISGSNGSGPTFVDYDGDGDLDLFIGGVPPTKPSLYRNTGDGTFEDVTESSGLTMEAPNTFSSAFGDYDMDGDLDLFTTHWLSGVTMEGMSSEHFWRNNGDGSFTDVSIESGITDSYINEQDYTFTPNFADINNDRMPDLLIAADFGASKVFLNNGDATFTDITTPSISDENGMGAAVGDYDNDLDLDWFVSSIFDPDEAGVKEGLGTWGFTGNRLYNNNGEGIFGDSTESSGVRHGFWGWASCFSDFNNDGYLDIFHVNGWSRDQHIASQFLEDPSRLFISNGNGAFSEIAFDAGIIDTDQGRGISCFDYDRDGDIDIFISNNNQNAKLYRNNGGNLNNFLSVKLEGLSPNSKAIGARIIIDIDGDKQMRELRAGSNFVSQNPAEAHFGVGNADMISKLLVMWPDGQNMTMNNVEANQFLVIQHPSL